MPRGHQTLAMTLGSVAVGATAGQHTQDLNELLIVAREAHAPVANPEAPFVVRARQLDDVAGRWVADEAIERPDARQPRLVRARPVGRALRRALPGPCDRRP